MLNITIILMFSITLLAIHFKTKDDGVLSPRMAYYLAFIPSVFLLYFYIDKWQINFSRYTVTVIITGVSIFAVVSLLTETYGGVVKRRIKIRGINLERQLSEIQDWKYIFFLIVQLFTVYQMNNFIIAYIGYGGLGRFLNTIRQVSVIEYVDIPGWLGALRVLCLASGYIWIYLLEKKVLFNGKKRFTEMFLLLANLVLSVYLSGLMGGRGNVIEYVVTAWIMFYALSGLSNNPKKYRRISYIIAAAIFVSAILFFQIYGSLIGRELSYDNFEYFMIYFSAPFKNLDLFLQEHKVNIGFFSGNVSGLAENYTLYPLLNYISINFNVEWLYHSRSLVEFYYPYRSINGNFLGNCYTVFASYLSDNGWFGLIFYSSFHAYMVQKIYNAVKKNISVQVNNGIYLTFIIYCKLWYYTFFSFFSDMFYYNAITVGFLRACICLVIVKIFLYNFDISIQKSRKCQMNI